MATRLQVFAASFVTLEEFARELERVLCMTFEFVPESPNNDTLYKCICDEWDLVALDAQGYQNVGDMLFENYTVFLQVAAGHESVRDALARFVYEALKATGKFSLMLVHDVQTKLDQFDVDKR